MDIIAGELCISRLEAIIFFSLHALDWADYTRYSGETARIIRPQLQGAVVLV
jgi:hypothetical protein